MFVHMSVHHVIPGKEKSVIEALKRLASACEALDGNISVHTMQDQNSGDLIALMLWNTKKQWQTARDIMAKALEEGPFDQWEERPPDVYHLVETWD